MSKTIASVIVLGIMGTASLAQEAGKAITPQKANAPAAVNSGSKPGGGKAAQVEKIDGARIKTAQAGKESAQKPVPPTREKTLNPGIKAAREAPGEKKTRER